MSEPEVTSKWLLSEKDYADRLISSYLDLQMKLLAFGGSLLTAVGGWLLAQHLDPGPRVTIQLLGSIVLSMLQLQSAAAYGIALGYMHYKNSALLPHLHAIAGPITPTPSALATWNSGPHAKPVLIAGGTLSVLVLLGSGCLALAAIASFALVMWWQWLMFLVALIVWVVSLVVTTRLGRAIDQLFASGGT